MLWVRQLPEEQVAMEEEDEQAEEQPEEESERPLPTAPACLFLSIPIPTRAPA